MLPRRVFPPVATRGAAGRCSGYALGLSIIGGALVKLLFTAPVVFIWWCHVVMLR